MGRTTTLFQENEMSIILGLMGDLLVLLRYIVDFNIANENSIGTRFFLSDPGAIREETPLSAAPSRTHENENESHRWQQIMAMKVAKVVHSDNSNSDPTRFQYQKI